MRWPLSLSTRRRLTRLVLLVEDEASPASSLSYYLRKNGFSVVSASNGVTGLQAARSDHPDVIVLDLMLPSNGWT